MLWAMAEQAGIETDDCQIAFGDANIPEVAERVPTLLSVPTNVIYTTGAGASEPAMDCRVKEFRGSFVKALGAEAYDLELCVV